MFSVPELLVHSPSFPVRGGDNKHAEMWHLETETRFLLGIYKWGDDQAALPAPLSHGPQLSEPRWPLTSLKAFTWSGWACSLHFQTRQVGGRGPSEVHRCGPASGQAPGHQRRSCHPHPEPRLVRAAGLFPLRGPDAPFLAPRLVLAEPQGALLTTVGFTQYARIPQTGSHLEEERVTGFTGQPQVLGIVVVVVVIIVVSLQDPGPLRFKTLEGG